MINIFPIIFFGVIGLMAIFFTYLICRSDDGSCNLCKKSEKDGSEYSLI